MHLRIGNIQRGPALRNVCAKTLRHGGNDMNTKILEYIIAIAEEKSISQAAERFYLSQPVLSRHLKKIEEDLGTPLFVRGKPHLTLTDAGIIYINNARAILHMEEQMNRTLEEMRRKQKDSLNLLIDAPYHNFFLRRIFPVFREKYPDFYIQYTDTNAYHAQKLLTEKKADLAVFATTFLNMEGLECLPLYTDELVIILPHNSQAATAAKSDAPISAALKNEIFALHPSGSTFRYMEDECLAAMGISPKTVLETASFGPALEAVYHRQCCAFLPKTRLMSVDPALIDILPSASPYIFYVAAAYSQSASFKAPVRELMQIISDQFQTFSQYVASRS